MSATLSHIATTSRGAWRPALLVLASGLIALAGLFHAEAAAAARVWGESTAFGHCWLVAPIAVWLAWERRGALAGLVPRPQPAMAVLALPLAAAWFVAERLGLMEGRQFCALFLAWLLLVSVLGTSVGRAMAVPLAYTLFLVPFGAFLVPTLQNVTARFIDAGLGALDVPHMVTDTIIEIPEGIFRVAEACAGLRFLIAAVAFGALYACVIYRSPWRRAAFIAVCVVVPVLANGVRALGIVLLGHLLGSAEAGAADHLLYGWIFFVLVLGLLLLLGLPFRQVFLPATESFRARVPLNAGPNFSGAPWRPALAVAGVIGLAAVGPALAGWLSWQAGADAAARAADADRLAASLAAPPGCVAQPGSAGRRRFTCDKMVLEARIDLFSRLAGPAVLRAWRDATPTGASTGASIGASIGEDETAAPQWLERPGGRWRVVSRRESEPPAERIWAAALWLDGAPAAEGLALRLALALAPVRTGQAARLLSVTVSGPASGSATRMISDFADAQRDFAARP